jgi:hypothetical protein
VKILGKKEREICHYWKGDEEIQKTATIA